MVGSALMLAGITAILVILTKNVEDMATLAWV
jgi:hypothetical protein